MALYYFSISQENTDYIEEKYIAEDVLLCLARHNKIKIKHGAEGYNIYIIR